MNPSSRPTHSPLAGASLTIATRESRLALWQAEHVQALLSRGGRTVNLLGMTTLGDQILDRSLSKVGGKGLFVKELETALEDGRADLAVHSLKDVPMDLPEGFSLACVMAREDPRDAFVSNQYTSLKDLPLGAVVGTSSLRRTVLLQALRPDLKIEPLRGNLDTRLRKLDEGHYAAIVLAAAGLKRLGLANRIASVFETDVMLPAAGQGALGIEIRADRQDLVAALAPLADQATWLAVAAERAVSRAMGGSCSMPLAAHAVWKRVGSSASVAIAGTGAASTSASGQQNGADVLENGASVLEISAAWGEPVLEDGVQAARPLVRACLARAVTDLEGAAALGAQVAAQLVAGGAKSLRREN